MTMPGAPNIYYGSEIGMTGGPDPGCRGAFPWDNEGAWDLDLLEYFRRAIALRHAYPAARTGSFTSLFGQNGVYAYMRELDGQQLIAVFNTNKQPVTVGLPLPQGAADGLTYNAIWGAGSYISGSGMLANVMVPAREALVLSNA